MTRLKAKKALVGDANDIRFGTHELVAKYRAKRIAALKPDTIIEIGAGAGFQTSELSKTAKKVIAIEIDKDRLSRAQLGSNVIAIAGDALDPLIIKQAESSVEGKVVVFVDPQRPANAEHRTIAEIKPDVKQVLAAYGKFTDQIIIEFPPQLSNEELDSLPKHEREYLSINGVLNRLTAYFGNDPCTSAVQLPGEYKIEASIFDPIHEGTVSENYVLDPDMALVKSGLVGNALADQQVIVEGIGNKHVYIAAKKSPSKLFKQRKILAHGNRMLIEKRLVNYQNLIIHGKLSPEEQRETLFKLKRFCRGKKGIVHLFMGRRWFLTE